MVTIQLSHEPVCATRTIQSNYIFRVPVAQHVCKDNLNALQVFQHSVFQDQRFEHEILKKSPTIITRSDLRMVFLNHV